MRSIRTLDDVFQGMSWLTHEQKMAIALALYANITLLEVINLKWSDTLRSDWRIDFILESVGESVEIDNVFWEIKDGKHVSLTSLPYIFGIATMWQSWELFLKNNSNSIPIEVKNYFSSTFQQTQQ